MLLLRDTMTPCAAAHARATGACLMLQDTRLLLRDTMTLRVAAHAMNTRACII